MVNLRNIIERKFDIFEATMMEGITARAEEHLKMPEEEILPTPYPTVSPTVESTEPLPSPTSQLVGTNTPVPDQVLFAAITPVNSLVEGQGQNFNPILFVSDSHTSTIFSNGFSHLDNS